MDPVQFDWDSGTHVGNSDFVLHGRLTSLLLFAYRWQASKSILGYISEPCHGRWGEKS